MDPATAASLLGVAVDASRADIDRAFRRRARLEHPDLTGDSTAFAAVTEARDVLIRAAGWRVEPEDPPLLRPRDAAIRRVGFELHPIAIGSLGGLLILGCLVAGIGTPSPFAPAEPVLRSVLLIGSVLGYAITRRRVLGILSAIAILATAAATLVWVTFGALLGAALMVPAITLLLLHGRNRAL